MYRRLLLLLPLLVAVGGGCDQSPQLAGGQPLDRSPPAPGRVTALGRLEPGRGVISVAGTTGELLGELLVEEGDQVQAGQVVARLQSYPIRAAETRQAEGRLANARSLLQAETAYGEALVDEAERALERARALQPVTLRAAELAVEVTTAQLKGARQELSRLEQLRKSQFVSEEMREQAATRVEVLTHQLEQAKVEVERVRLAARLELTGLEAALASARATRDRLVAAADVAPAELMLGVAREVQARAEIRAPITGRVLRVATRPGGQLSAAPILELGDTGAMYAVAEVYETDVARVRPGAQATVRSPALAGPLSGRVEQVGLIIHKNDVLRLDPRASKDTRVIEVRIRLDDAAAAAAYNWLEVEVEIATDQPPAPPAEPAAPPAEPPAPPAGPPAPPAEASSVDSGAPGAVDSTVPGAVDAPADEPPGEGR